MMLTGPPNDLKVAAFSLNSDTTSIRCKLKGATRIARSNKELVAHSNTRLLYVTDHFNLTFWSVYNANFNTTASRRIRNGYDYLQTVCGAFQPVIVHRRGVDIPHADALSRNSPPVRSSNEQLSDYLNGDINEQINSAYASNIDNHERATRMANQLCLCKQYRQP